MIDLPYSLVIEATDDPDFFGFYSPELTGFTGVGHSIEDCIYKARHGMADHVATLSEHGKAVPDRPERTTVLIKDSEPANVS
jgi:predicted RNase H-like HicB family nuclease